MMIENMRKKLKILTMAMIWNFDVLLYECLCRVCMVCNDLRYQKQKPANEIGNEKKNLNTLFDSQEKKIHNNFIVYRWWCPKKDALCFFFFWLNKKPTNHHGHREGVYFNNKQKMLIIFTRKLQWKKIMIFYFNIKKNDGYFFYK